MNDENNLSEESGIKTVFDLFKNTKSSEQDLLKLFEAKKKLNIKDNDAIWLILIIMESYNQNFLSTSEDTKHLLLNFPEILESKLDILLERTKLVLEDKILLDIEEKSLDLQAKLTDEIINLVKSQSNKLSNSNTKIKNKTFIIITTCCIISSCLSAFFSLFLLAKLAFG